MYIEKTEEKKLEEEIKNTLKLFATEIDEEFKNKDEFLKTNESKYVDLTAQKLTKAIYEPKQDIINTTECYWLGSRRGVLQKIIKQSQDIKTKTELLAKIGDFLKEYKESLYSRYKSMISEREKANTFYHGSTDCNIIEFTPRDETKGGSKGDIIPLVYAAYNKNLALSFIFKKGLHHTTKQDHKGPNAYYKTTIENLIMDHDIGGILYEFSGEQANNFRIDMAKDRSEVVCHEPVEPTKKTEVISALNELLQSDFAVFYDDENEKPKKLKKEDLENVREKCIQNLTQLGEKITKEQQKTLQRLIKQKENLQKFPKQKNAIQENTFCEKLQEKRRENELDTQNLGNMK